MNKNEGLCILGVMIVLVSFVVGIAAAILTNHLLSNYCELKDVEIPATYHFITLIASVVAWGIVFSLGITIIEKNKDK